jgi:hypothetical protein
MSELACRICGTCRDVGQWDINRGNGKYCSRSCYHASQRTRVEFACAICGKPAYCFAAKMAAGKGKYCSRQCFATARRKEDRVKDNPAHLSWRGMKKRCLDPNNPKYSHYGGRGIRVCDRWANSFAVFLEDMGPRPFGQTLDRIDVDGDYEPTNCRWASPLTQSRNRRNTIMVGEDMPLAEYAEMRGVRYASLFRRLKAGMTAEEAADYLIHRGCTISPQGAPANRGIL